MEVLQRTANRGSISTDTAYEIGNSIKFETANTESLTKSQTASNRRTWTVSFWFKKTKVDSALQYIFEAGINSSTLLSLFVNGTTDWRIYEYVSGSRNLAFYSTSPLRDSAAWYHIVIACDTTQSTAANRFKIYLNGEDLTAVSGYFSTAAYPAQNYETQINNSNATLSIGKAPTASTNFCGYISEFNFIDGLMKDAEDFGKYDSASNIWQPIEYTGSYGNQGYFLNFADSGDLGDDESGNGKDFTENNIAAIDQSTDTPTNNFATLNNLQKFSGTSSNNPTHTEGATIHTSTLDDYWQTSIATIGVTSGKWYFEARILDDNTPLVMVGVGDEGDIPTWGLNNGYLGDGKSVSYSSGSSAYTHAHTIGMAVDVDNGKVYWAKDNTYISSGNPAGNANGTALPTGGVCNGTYFIGVSGYKDDAAVLQVNFGGYHANSLSSAASDANGYGTFEFAPPSGFYALCTKNLAEYGG